MRFDAALIVSFGGPQGMDDIRPFLANVLRGRRVSPERVEAVAQHYEHFGGISPLTAYTLQQAAGLKDRLAAAGYPIPVFVGMRNWHPLLADTFRQMSAAGIRQVVAFVSAAQHSYSSCQQYRENVEAARTVLRSEGRPDVAVTYVDSWFEHELFVEVNAAHVAAARTRLSPAAQDRARLVFTAHSVPATMASRSRYVEQLRSGAAAVAARVGMADWALVFQSRSGRPEDPWLEPDIRDYLREQRAAGLTAVVISPIGFVCDHVEVLWDLDEEAASDCRALGIEMARAEAANADPIFMDLMADVVLRTVRRAERGRLLRVVAAPQPADATPAGRPLAGRPATA